MQIDCRGIDIGVPQELLDEEKVDTFIQQVCGKGVTQRADTGLFLDRSSGDGVLKGPLDSTRGQRRFQISFGCKKPARRSVSFPVFS